jgi:hypothetical protein
VKKLNPKTVRTTGCPACSATRGTETKVGGVYTCAKCGGIFGTCYKGDSYSLVLPCFAKEPVAPEALRYFDLTTLGSDGVHRVHGWFDPQTRLVHQVG